MNTDRFGIEFAPEVVQADGNVRNLAWRVCNAKQVLVSHYAAALPNRPLCSAKRLADVSMRNDSNSSLRCREVAVPQPN